MCQDKGQKLNFMGNMLETTLNGKKWNLTMFCLNRKLIFLKTGDKIRSAGCQKF